MKCTWHILLLILSTSTSLFADDWPQWRGPQRNGISRETVLLKEWPEAGPKLIWNVTDAGSGYSTPAVVGDRREKSAGRKASAQLSGATLASGPTRNHPW